MSRVWKLKLIGYPEKPIIFIYYRSKEPPELIEESWLTRHESAIVRGEVDLLSLNGLYTWKQGPRIFLKEI